MTEILRVTLVVTLLTIGLACYFLVVGAFFNGLVSKTGNIAKSMPWRSLGIGSVNFLFFGAIAFALFAVSEGVNGGWIRALLLVPALLISAGLTILASFGLTAMIGIVGERVFPEMPPWRRAFWGTVILAFGSAIPTVGWFLLLPYIGLTGIGAVILGFFQREGA